MFKALRFWSLCLVPNKIDYVLSCCLGRNLHLIYCQQTSHTNLKKLFDAKGVVSFTKIKYGFTIFEKINKVFKFNTWWMITCNALRFSALVCRN